MIGHRLAEVQISFKKILTNLVHDDYFEQCCWILQAKGWVELQSWWWRVVARRGGPSIAWCFQFPMNRRLQIYLLDLGAGTCIHIHIAGIQEAYVAFNMMTEIGSLPAIETYNSPYAKVGSSRRQRPSILG